MREEVGVVVVVGARLNAGYGHEMRQEERRGGA
jgi:hypothetical protein